MKQSRHGLQIINITVVVYLFNFSIAISSIADVIFVLPWLAVHNVVGHNVAYSVRHLDRGGYPSHTEVSVLRSKSRLTGANKPKALVTVATDKLVCRTVIYREVRWREMWRSSRHVSSERSLKCSWLASLHPVLEVTVRPSFCRFSGSWNLDRAIQLLYGTGSLFAARFFFFFFCRNVGTQDSRRTHMDKRVACVSWIVFEIQGLLLQLFPSWGIRRYIWIDVVRRGVIAHVRNPVVIWWRESFCGSVTTRMEIRKELSDLYGLF